MLAVQGDVLLPLHGLEQLFHLHLLGVLVLEGLRRQLVGVDDQAAHLAVDIRHPTGVLLLQAVPQTADGGDAHGPGQDGSVAVAGAALGGKGQNLALVQLHSLGGGQVVRRQNHWLLGVDASGHNAHQIVENPAGHVQHVRRAGLHVGVVHIGEHGGKLLARLLDRVLNITLLRLQHGQDVVHIVLVLHEHAVGLEEDGGLVAGLRPGFLRQYLQLLYGFLLGVGQTLLFSLRICRRLGYCGVCALVEVERTLFHAGRDAFSLH